MIKAAAKHAPNPHSELRILSIKKWQATGELSRTAAILTGLLRKYPRLRISYSVDYAISAINIELTRINADYEIAKAAIIAARGYVHNRPKKGIKVAPTHTPIKSA